MWAIILTPKSFPMNLLEKCQSGRFSSPLLLSSSHIKPCFYLRPPLTHLSQQRFVTIVRAQRACVIATAASCPPLRDKSLIAIGRHRSKPSLAHNACMPIHVCIIYKITETILLD